MKQSSITDSLFQFYAALFTAQLLFGTYYKLLSVVVLSRKFAKLSFHRIVKRERKKLSIITNCESTYAEMIFLNTLT